MPIRLRRIAAFFLSAAVAASGEEKIITGAFDLNTLSATLPASTSRSITARIDKYASPGQLRIGANNGVLDTLILQRHSNESDSAILVDSTFIDAKGFTGTLILKNLAFRLGPKAALIAGFDLNKPNRNLTLDSCYLFADTLDGAFVSWQGDPLSNVEIRNSWFVGRGSVSNAANLQFTAANATLKNCLFNYAGIITASVSGRIDVISNTVNRVQFKLTSNALGGSDPFYLVSQNLFAFPGPVNALSGEQAFYAMKATGFNEVSSSIQGNRMFSVWRGIDAPAGAKGAAGGNETTVSPYYDKAPGELWDWYTDQFDPNTGMLSGNRALRRFNVLPGRLSADTGSGPDTLSVLFRGADFPRTFRMVLGPAPALADSALRLREPYAGSLSFGPFQVSEIRHNAAASNGKPILLALANGQFQPQPSQAKVKVAPSIFQNRAYSSRTFALVDSGNTPKGSNISPPHPSFASFEGLTFTAVEQAGETTPITNAQHPVPDSLRYLDREFGFQTTATVNTALTFRSAKAPKTVIWAREGNNGLLWYWKSKGTTSKALPGTAPGDSLIYGTFSPYRNSDGAFSAYLVEKLSIHAGDAFRMPLEAGAYVLSYSKSGYQLYPTASLADTTRFDSASAAYSFTWTGRGGGDSAFFVLKRPSPSAQVFVSVPGRPGPEPLSPQPGTDSAGNFRIPLAPGDTGKLFFAGIKYTVLAGPPDFEGILDDVSVANLATSRSGRLGFRDLPLADARKLGEQPDSVFRNTSYLGGRKILADGLDIQRPYDLGFKVRKPQTPDKIEVWALENGKWLNITPRGKVKGDSAFANIPAGSTHIVVVERFQAPETYFTDSLRLLRDSLVFFLTPKVAETSPILAYCVETRSIHPDGRVVAGPCERKATNQPTRIKLDTANGYAYRIIYFEGAPGDSVALIGEFAYPEHFGWNAKALLKDTSLKALREVPQGQWQLVSLPAAGRLARMIAKKPQVGAGNFRDTTVAWDLKMAPGGRAFYDTNLVVRDLEMSPAKAFLVAASRPFDLVLDSFPNLARRTPKPETVAVKAGWNLVGNPYPVSINRKCVRAKSGVPLRLREFRAKEGGGYAWDSIASVLKPFRGFAVFLPANDVLYFDPADTGASGAAKPAAKPLAGPSRVRVGIESDFGESSMALVRGAGEYPIRFLPGVSAGLEMRVGGDGGYWILPVEDPARIEQPLEIRSARDGIARFSLGEDGLAPAFALIDEATGAVYDAAAAQSLPVSEGSRSYRLIAGDPGFIAAKTGAFLAAAPGEIALSQNFPNPARGLTRIEVAWPATRGGDRAAYLEVRDLQGRRLAFRRLDGIRVGRQRIDLDASGWRQGIYVYRLVVTQGGAVTRLQKRMLVAP